jgi:hypothetical protein
MQALIAWILAAMAVAWSLTSKIPGPVPKDIAEAIAKSVIEKPLFSGGSGERQSASMMLGIARYESGFRQAYGDCKGLPPGDADCGKDAKLRARGLNPADHPPQSFCFMQVHLPNGQKTAEGWTGEELMQDSLKCARAAREIIRQSIKTSPSGKPLLQYAGKAREAETRWELAQKLYKTVPEVPIKCDE